MDKLADGLQKLGEDDLLQVVQMVHDNKSPDSYTKNDVERKHVPYPVIQSKLTDLCLQRENSTSTCTPSQTTSSRCSGTLCRTRESSE